jgi:hypothetical protein
LGIDTIQDKKDKAFVQHEVQFYEGIASVLSDTLTFIDFDNNVIKILHRFIYWIKQRHVYVSNQIDYFFHRKIEIEQETRILLCENKLVS